VPSQLGNEALSILNVIVPFSESTTQVPKCVLMPSDAFLYSSGVPRRLSFDAVGKPLFKKHGRGLALTEAGELTLRFGRQMLALNDELLDTIQGASLTDHVRVGFSQDFADRVLPTVLARFAHLYAGLWASAMGGLGLTLRSRLSLPDSLIWHRRLFNLPEPSSFPVTLHAQRTRRARASIGCARSSATSSPSRCRRRRQGVNPYV
jgi:hypothetical protein